MTSTPAFDDPSWVTHALASSTRKSLFAKSKKDFGFQQLDNDEHADLAIAGGGLLGLWTALEAKQRNPDQRVIVIDANRIGGSSSSRSAGVAYASLTHGPRNAKARWPEDASTLERLGDENLAGLRQDLVDLGIDAHVREGGMLTVALSADDATTLRRSAIADRGVYCDAAATQERIASPEFRGGYFDPTAAVVLNPQLLVEGLITACVERGVEFFENTKANELELMQKSVGIETSAASLHADRLVLATGAFRSLLIRHRLAAVPVYDYVLATQPLNDEQWERAGWHDNLVLREVTSPFRFGYVTDDRRIIWGGSQATYLPPGSIRAANETRREAYEATARDFFTAFPQLSDVRFSNHWSGVINMSSSFTAQASLVDTNVVTATGFTGQGITSSRFFAHTCLDLLDGVSTERTRLGMVQRAPLPFPPEPFTSAAIKAATWSLTRAEQRGGRRNAIMQTLDALSGGGPVA